MRWRCSPFLWLFSGNLYLSSRRLNINKAVHLIYISYKGMRKTCGYSFWRICTSCLQLKKRHQERFSWLLEQWSTLQHSKVTPRPFYAWGYVLISRINGFKCNFSVRPQFETYWQDIFTDIASPFNHCITPTQTTPQHLNSRYRNKNKCILNEELWFIGWQRADDRMNRTFKCPDWVTDAQSITVYKSVMFSKF